MSEIEAKIEALGLTLPEPIQVPAGVVLPFSWVRVHENRAYVSGHVALNADGSLAEPLGKVGAELSEEGWLCPESGRATAHGIGCEYCGATWPILLC